MQKGQISFAVAGVIFGFLVGFVVAHQVYVGRGGPDFQHPPLPAGMGGPAGPGGGAPPRGMAGGAPGGEGGAATMEAVQKQIADLKAILASDPENLDALVGLGNLYFDAGMFDGAAGYYEQALEVTPADVSVRTDLGTAYRRMGQPGKALDEFHRAVGEDPSHWRGWFNIGVVSLYDLGRFDQAEEAFRKVDVLNPGSIDMTALREEIERVRAEGTGAGG
jgi:hypothetical protein